LTKNLDKKCSAEKDKNTSKLSKTILEILLMRR
jgi:hypothetical protein